MNKNDSNSAYDSRSVEAVWLAKAKNGDSEAFCQLVKPFEDRLVRQAYLMCREQHLAEELAQETLIAAWKGTKKFDGKCQFFTWLYGILIRIHKNKLRQSLRKPISFFGLQMPDFLTNHNANETQTPKEHLEEQESKGLIFQAIEKLPDAHREVVLLKYFADASTNEIAHIQKVSIGTVKSRLHHALIKLKNMNLQSVKES